MQVLPECFHLRSHVSGPIVLVLDAGGNDVGYALSVDLIFPIKQIVVPNKNLKGVNGGLLRSDGFHLNNIGMDIVNFGFQYGVGKLLAVVGRSSEKVLTCRWQFFDLASI